jgi:hypothetical protein
MVEYPENIQRFPSPATVSAGNHSVHQLSPITALEAATFLTEDFLEICHLLKYSAVYSVYKPTFRGNISSPSTESKSSEQETTFRRNVSPPSSGPNFSRAMKHVSEARFASIFRVENQPSKIPRFGKTYHFHFMVENQPSKKPRSE